MAKVKDQPWYPDAKMKRITIYQSDYDTLLNLIEKERRGGTGRKALTIQDAFSQAIHLVASQYD